MTAVIRVENLSKLYRLGETGTGSLAHDINRWWHRVRGKEDPYTKIGDTNDRETKSDSDYAWALKDVNFDINRGEVVGIIGRNGAGKSTLLKILSRVTSPTCGSVKAKGRIASLLEVGTGFHPELTGRENIFLNGAILGMRKQEISRKLDEIISFSGCERYINTPVKRYSSGMYVRLAFAVAAHLDPEIMIIDEVLAVGDGDFQQKCLGKMRNMHEEGRTVLIVSHQLNLISSLCNKAILMNCGTIKMIGPVTDVVKTYFGQNTHQTISGRRIFEKSVGDYRACVVSVQLEDSDGTFRSEFLITESILITFEYVVNTTPATYFYAAIELYDESNQCIFNSTDWQGRLHRNMPLGSYASSCEIPPHLLNCGTYTVRVALVSQGTGHDCCFYIDDAICFEVTENVLETVETERNGFAGKIIGLVRPMLTWKTRAI